MKIPNIPADGISIYLYYGNETVVSASDGNSTFNFFDDDWKLPNPVQASSQPSWESNVSNPVVFQEGSNYYMLYDGHDIIGHAKGLATSSDLVNWIPDNNNPIMGVGFEGNNEFAWGDVIKVGSTYHMFPSKGIGTTVHVQSNDLVNWTGFDNDLVTDDASGISTNAEILKEGDGITPVMISGKYWMIYSNGYGPGNLYIAYSEDLDNWFMGNDGNPILTGGDWDTYIWTSCFVKIGSTYFIYYQGSIESSDNFSIGFASANASDDPDKVTFTKSLNNPVIVGNHDWDDGDVEDPVLRYFNGTYYLFYTGAETANGFATSENPEGPWTQLSSLWIKGGVPSTTEGILNIGTDNWVRTSDNYSSGSALGFRAKYLPFSSGSRGRSAGDT